MNTKSISFFLPIIVLSQAFESLHVINETLTQEYRQPRVTGRIVKVYSGTRPQPIICPGEGFQADPLDCSVFYRCIVSTNGKYTSFRFQCGPGTIYDPEAEVCNFPQNTRRSECGGVTAQFVPRHYKNELDNTNYELPSPIINLPYSEETTTKSKQSTSSPFTTKRHAMSSPALPWMQTTLNQSRKPSESPTTTRQQNSHSGDPCTNDGFIGDSEDCRKFYRCVGNLRGGFIRYEFMCSENTIWDDDAKSCNHAWAVQRQRCGRGYTLERTATESKEQSSKSDETTKPTIQQQLQINYGSKVSQTQTQISNGSGVLQNQTQINYGDRTDNKRESSIKQNQTQIAHGSAVSQTQTQINYGNKGTQTQLQIDHSKEASQSQTQIQHENDQVPESGSSAESSNNENTSNKCTQSGFMGDKKECKKFYRCVDNGKGSYTKYEFSCGDGTVWDSNIEGCNHAWAVKDCGGKSPSTNNTQNNQAVSTTTAPATSTQNYYTTKDDEEEMDSPYGNNNPISDNNSQQTSSTIITTTTTTTTTTATPDKNEATSETIATESTECSSSGFIGDKNDCKKFYRCVDNGQGSFTKYEFKCGEGTVWDSEIEACNHAWAVKKCGGSSTADNTIQIETTTKTDEVLTTVTLIQTTTELSGQNNDYEGGYGQQNNQSPSTTTTTTTTRPQNGEGDKCKSSGFMGDKNDCKKFYRCVDNGNGAYTRYEFSCGEGTVWDPKIEACNHPWAVERCGEDNTDFNKETTTHKAIEETTQSSSTKTQTVTTSTKEPTTHTEKPASDTHCTKEGFVGDSKDCKKFYRCVDNGRGGFIKYEFTCGDGTVWDPEISTCNYPTSNYSCSISGSQSSNGDVAKEDDEINTEITTVQSTTSTTVSAGNTASTSSRPETVDKTCKTEGFYGDPHDCKKFYRCVDNGKGGFTKYDFTCGEGTVWDQEIQGCNHASEKNNCAHGSSSQSQTSTESTSATESQQEHSTPKPEPTAKPEPTTKPESSTDDYCTSEGFYANSKDCQKFYRCVDNGNGRYTKYDFTCGEGTTWVQELQTCDHEDSMMNCSKVHNSSTQETNNTQQAIITSTMPPKEHDEYPSEPSNGSPTTTTTSTTASGSTTTSDEKCITEGFYSNKNDCTRFYRCVDNGNGGYTKYDFTCGEGTAWDSDIQTCNHKSEVKSCQDSNQSKPEEHDEGNTESFTTTKTSTISSGSTTESTKPESTDTCEKEGYYGNKDDCTKFYRCVDNGNGGYTKYDFNCGEGTIWDQDITTCNHPQDVENPSCKQSEGSSTSSSSSDTSSTTSTTESSSGTTQNNTENCSQEDSSKKPADKDVNCTEAGFYADPNDCKKFYRCVDWDGEGQKFSVFHFECGEGTIWDPALDTCNHEDSVYPPRDCSGSQSQNESSSQEPTEGTSTTQEESTTSKDDNTTTTQATTEEQTTTQQSTTQKQTTTEQTTTQKSTTNQPQTTTEQLTTQQTTTQKSTTSEQITTQQSTTSEQTTTQQSTTSEQTTAQETTTSQQTTAEQSTANEQSTTQESTTKQTTEQTTTQQSTTSSEETTTQQSTTSEESTTQQSTTQQSTTQQTITDSTTDSSTTEQTTSQSNETTEQTTSTTEQQTESSTTESEQESTTENEQGTTESSSHEKECPETDDDQHLFVCPTSFKRHPKYCNLFYQCEEDDESHEVKIAVFKCPNETIYDETHTKCVEKDKADKKCDGEMARKRRIKRFDANYNEPVIISKDNFSCPAIGNYQLEKEECSPAFLKCQKSKSGKLRGFVYQCPEGYLYWSISKRCEQQNNVKFCKKSLTAWSRRREIPVERKNVAK